MSMYDILLPVARARGQIRLVDGRVATLVSVKTSRARIHFAPNDPGCKGDGHTRTVPISEILEVVTASVCICTPCTTPAATADGLEHCAACCAGSLIEAYDHLCPVPRHAVLAVRQFGPIPTEETPHESRDPASTVGDVVRPDEPDDRDPVQDDRDS